MTVPRPELELSYALHLMPPGRVAFRRWRWELWEGGSLLATGWRMSERHAERALRAAASRVAHGRVGLHPLRPEDGPLPTGFRAGVAARLDFGPVSCWLVPRASAAGQT